MQSRFSLTRDGVHALAHYRVLALDLGSSLGPGLNPLFLTVNRRGGVRNLKLIRGDILDSRNNYAVRRAARPREKSGTRGLSQSLVEFLGFFLQFESRYVVAPCE